MAWENIAEKLKRALQVKISFPAGTVWLPVSHLSIDDWLTSIAETDGELRELNIPRIRFLQNRWLIATLIELEWDDQFSNRRAVLAMYAGQRAYILFSDWKEYQVIAAIEPNDKPSLYRAVIGKLLENQSFVPTRPTLVRNRRPDLVGELLAVSREDAPTNWTHPAKPEERWKGFLTDIFVGWIGKWLNTPEMGFWHEEMPKSIARTENGEIVMKYKLSYGDKQREAQKRESEKQPQVREMSRAVRKPSSEQTEVHENRPKGEGKGAA